MINTVTKWRQRYLARLIFIGMVMVGNVLLACNTFLTPTSTPTPTPSAYDYNQQGLEHAFAGDPAGAMQYFKQAIELEPTNADYWNNLCWFGSLAGHADEVLDACHQAVELFPEAGYIRDSRGLAYALTGNTKRAITDFKFFVAWSQEYEDFEYLRPKREAWIIQLEAGQNPFNEAILQELLTE